MRSIKFRAWWKNPKYNPKGKMYFVGGILFAEKQEGEPEYDNCDIPKEVGLMTDTDNSKIGWNDAKDCILMQFTGLKDKNGKEIYEGDIVEQITRIPATKKKPAIEIRSVPFIIVWGEKGWKMEHDGDTCDSTVNAYVSGEVIGNIYENPELLEKTI